MSEPTLKTHPWPDVLAWQESRIEKLEGLLQEWLEHAHSSDEWTEFEVRIQAALAAEESK